LSKEELQGKRQRQRAGRIETEEKKNGGRVAAASKVFALI
jgi:hypothetical protein